MICRWKSFEECLTDLLKWLHEIENLLVSEPQLKSTLDEKRAQLTKYKTIFDDSTLRNQDIIKLKTMFDSFSQKDEDIEFKLKSVTTKYDEVLKKAEVSSISFKLIIQFLVN